MFQYSRVNDKAEYFEIMKFAFAIKKKLWESFIKRTENFFSDENREPFGIYLKNELIAEYLLLSLKMKLRDSVISMGGISNLCTKPLYRGKGAVKFLLEKSLKTMREKGHAISLLYPFDVEFYRKYGWETFDTMLGLTVSPGAIRIDYPEKVEAKVFKKADKEIKDFYNHYAMTHYTMVLKDEEIWKDEHEFWTDEDIEKNYVKFSINGEVTGLLRYVLMNKTSAETVLYIPSFLTDDSETEKTMWSFVKKLSLQIKEVKITLPPDYVVWQYFHGTPKEMKIIPRSMIRIVDLKALNGLKLSCQDINIKIRLKDKLASWNNGTFMISIKDQVMKVSETTNPELECDINTLSAIIGGKTNFKEMIDYGRAIVLENYNGQDIPKELPFVLQGF